MKHLIRTAMLAVMALVMMPGTASAQTENPLTQQLPTDPAVRIGKLPNGLTYYIRHNELPKGQADFYIAQSVGSALEEDNQRGLAHFLEHMCFNGTTNFPDNQLREWLESIGVKFGANLNAYTSIDQTVYNISNVPVARTSVQDSCLLILHDWANDLTLDPAEIDKERGVIHEEWRRSMQGQMRIMEKALPLLYPDTKYGERLPIGTMEIVDNFAPQALRDYYETWYRPDQQAIIVVGDIDVDRIEGKIKEMFSSIEMPANPKERTYQPVPDHKGTLYAIGSDPEQKQYVASLMILNEKFPREQRNTPAYYLDSFIKTMAASMLNNRLNDLSNDPKAPFANAGFDFGDYIISKNKGAVDIQTVAKGNDIIVPLQTVYREVLRAARHGFTQSELDRTLQMYLTAYERAYNNRASAENESFVGEYVNHFLDNEPIPGIEIEWPMMRQIASMVTLDDINRLMASAITPDNRSVLVMAPEKEEITLPTPAQISEALAAVDAETIEAYTDNVKTEPLITKAPVPGKIISTRHDDQWDATVWTLSNGATVYVKPTKYKEDEIRFTASAMGGYSDYPAEYAPTILTLPNILNMYGLGSYSSTELRKYLAGKIAGIGMSFGPYSRSISGNTTPRDLPTLMELTYMAFTDTQFDPTEFESMQSSLSAMMANQEKDPRYIFQKSMTETLYDSPFRAMATPETVNAASRELATQMVHDFTSNAADYTFVFVGNIDLDTLRPLVETYIASLPGNTATARKERPTFDPGMFPKAGSGINSFTTPMTTPSTLVSISEIGEIPYNTKNAQIASIAGQILTNRLIKTVREDMGAVYSIGAQGQGSSMGLNPFMLSTSFPMKPELKEQVLDYIKGEFKAMESNITAEELNPIKEYMAKSFAESRERNGAWLGAINSFALFGSDNFNNATQVLDTITVQDIMDYMKALNGQNNYRVITLDPAAE